jgi:hypothetical protein
MQLLSILYGALMLFMVGSGQERVVVLQLAIAVCGFTLTVARRWMTNNIIVIKCSVWIEFEHNAMYKCPCRQKFSIRVVENSMQDIKLLYASYSVGFAGNL